MNISQKGIELIKKYEGCRLQAYLCPAGVWTIGYGHTGGDVFAGKTITQPVAEQFLIDDLKKFETQVIGSVSLSLNQSQFDALVSFAYNCGVGNLKTLVKNRNHNQIAAALLLYNKANGKVLEGLNRRRKEERELFLSGSTTGNPYKEPTIILKKGSVGDSVKWLQYEFNQKGYNLTIDGKFGNLTDEAVRAFQAGSKLTVDGIVGEKTRQKLRK